MILKAVLEDLGKKTDVGPYRTDDKFEEFDPDKSKLYAHAKRELDIAKFIKPDDTFDAPYGDMIGIAVLELIATFSCQGHSGMSAGYVRQIFDKLAKYEPLEPLTGEDDEWEDISAMWGKEYYQNKRCSRIFKDETGKAYDTEAIIFRDLDGGCYTSAASHQEIKFPYTPKTKILDSRIDPGKRKDSDEDDINVAHSELGLVGDSITGTIEETDNGQEIQTTSETEKDSGS